MADAASLHCPNCGAVAATDAQRCPYCSARLATISCPSCFALMFDSAAFCERCGARRARTAEGDESEAPCPGCGTALVRVAIGSTEMFECASCDGVWVAADVFERICSDRESQAAVLHRATGSRSVAAEPVRYRRCLTCGTMMNRVNFGKVSGTIVDVCRGHGTFLDRGELQQIMRFIHGGGLEQARERQIQELREQEQRLRARELRAARDRGRSDPHAAIDISGGSPGAAILDLLKMLKD